MKVEVEKLGNSQVSLSIEISAEEISQELERNCQALRTKVSVPGFRKGKVPLSILKSRFAEHLKAEAIQNLVPPAYEQALISERLIPLGNLELSPPMNRMELKDGQPLAFEATLDVKPDFALPEYEDLVIDKSPPNVPREEVEEYIQRLQEQFATYIPLEVNRPVEESDSVAWLIRLPRPDRLSLAWYHRHSVAAAASRCPGGRGSVRAQGRRQGRAAHSPDRGQ